MRAVTLSDEEDKQEKALCQVYETVPDGRPLLEILRKKQERRRIGETLHITIIIQWLLHKMSTSFKSNALR